MKSTMANKSLIFLANRSSFHTTNLSPGCSSLSNVFKISRLALEVPDFCSCRTTASGYAFKIASSCSIELCSMVDTRQYANTAITHPRQIVKGGNYIDIRQELGKIWQATMVKIARRFVPDKLTPPHNTYEVSPPWIHRKRLKQK